MARAGIITIGDEILIGQITDTNSGWIGQQLTQRGIDIKTRWSVGDNVEDIREALQIFGKKCDLVLVTGGLGPTRDDVTKKAICDFFNTELYFDQDNFDWITRLFASFGREPLEIHRQQAYLPRGCEVLANKLGTAPGMLMIKDGIRFVFTPGVPHEMKEIMNESFLPRLGEWYSLPPIQYLTLHTAGMGESMIAGLIDDVESNLPEGVSLAYLPGAGSVRVRLLIRNQDDSAAKITLGEVASRIEERLGEVIYGRDGSSLALVVGEMLKSRGKMLVLAESCTGGYVAHQLTSNPGSSQYFKGGMVTYSNALKIKQLGVDDGVIRSKGAVSEEVVRQMAVAALDRMGGDISLSISGIAGPTGGGEKKPIGLVWMAVSDGERTVARKYNFGKSRLLNIQYAGTYGLNLIRKFLLGSEMQ